MDIFDELYLILVKAKPLHDILKTSDLTSRFIQPIKSSKGHKSRLPLDSCNINTNFQLSLSTSFYSTYWALAKSLGCALYQIQENQLRISGYGSRTLVPAENKYNSSKLEFLTFKKGCLWTLQGLSLLFTTVYTDFNPTTYLFTLSKINDTGQQWVNKLFNLNFSVNYKLGI